MDFSLIQILQFILAISLLILLHEGGHFLFARLFKIRVEKFYLFFDPWFHLFEFKPKNSDTTYGLGWLPLGGYCKISGMIDESFDTDQMKQPAQPWEFRTKPAWQRLLVMIGGVTVNFVTALFIYSMIMFCWGESYISTSDMTHGMKFNSEAKALGFQDGDILLGTDNGTFKEFGSDMYRDISKAKRVDLIRDGKEMSITLPGDINMLNMIRDTPPFVRPLIPAVVDSVMPGSAAENIGLQKGDKIVALNGKDIDSYNAFTDEIGILSDVLSLAKSDADSMKVRNATIVFARGEQLDTASIVLSADLKVGFYTQTIAGTYKITTKKYDFFESIPAGINYGIDVLSSYISDMQYVFSSEGVKSLGGFGTIANLFPSSWDWLSFWNMTAFLSIILAFMNILPIPALDGGHVVFLLYEMITRRQPGEKFMLWAEYAGFGILILLMIIANLNDILRIFGFMTM